MPKNVKQDIEKKLNHVIGLCKNIINMYKHQSCSERAMLLMALFIAVKQISAQLHAIASALRKDLLDPYKIDYLGYARKIEDLYKIWNEEIKSNPTFHNVDLSCCTVVISDLVQHEEDDYDLTIKALDKDFDWHGTRVALMENAELICENIGITLIDLGKTLRGIIQDNLNMKENIHHQKEILKEMESKYVDSMWGEDKGRFISEVNEFVAVSGDKSEKTYKLFLLRMDRKATDPHKIKPLAELNDHYLAGGPVASFIVDNKERLSAEDLVKHFKFVNCRKLVVDELEVYRLNGPPDKDYHGLFVNKAAQELAFLLSHTINRYVDFRHNYQYSALQMVMMDVGMVINEGRNSKQMMHFLNEVYLKGNNPIKDQTTLTTWISKLLFKKFGTIDASNLRTTSFSLQDFHKIKDHYWHCLSIINKVLSKDLDEAGFAPYLCKEHPKTPALVDYKDAGGLCVMDRLLVLNSAFSGFWVFD